MHDYFRGTKPWRKLANVLSRLPAEGSHYKEAQRNDPQVVEWLMSRDEEEQTANQWRPRAEDMSLTNILLAKVFDRLGELTARQMAEPLPHGAKKPTFPHPFPQPARALDMAREKAEQQYLDELDQDVAEAQARWAAQQAKEAGDGRSD